MYAKYTEVLGDLMKNSQTSELLSKALSTYPLYESKVPESIDLIPNRSELNQRLLNAYKYREIGFETVGRFLDELEMTMCEIMPRYNELYKTIEIMAGLENPFDNVDIVETFEEDKTGTGTNTDKITKSATDTRTTTGTTEAESTTESDATASTETSSSDSTNTSSTVSNKTKNVHSDTPQSQLNITANNIDSVQYADSVAWNNSDSTDSAQTTGSSSSTVESTNINTTEGSAKTTINETNTSDAQESSDLTAQRTTTEKNSTRITRKGNHGVNTYAHDMIEFRTSIIDVTNQIINDERISELFMRVF